MEKIKTVQIEDIKSNVVTLDGLLKAFNEQIEGINTQIALFTIEQQSLEDKRSELNLKYSQLYSEMELSKREKFYIDKANRDLEVERVKFNESKKDLDRRTEELGKKFEELELNKKLLIKTIACFALLLLVKLGVDQSFFPQMFKL